MGGVTLWIVISIVALVVDIFTSSFFFAGFTVGGIFALLAWLIGWGGLVQFIVFGVVSVAAVSVEYLWFRKIMKKTIPKTLRMEQEYIGRTITAEENIEYRGRIKVEGIYWTVQNSGAPIEKGEKAKIVGIEGNKLIIKK